ncbi:epiplakin-like [Phaenicophaeus curvirostris]|uniref:epiplakin-like n=1 Tax=Phaenicophaeus curvirostris TaxID=33595 RepID=UPI0037F0FA87
MTQKMSRSSQNNSSNQDCSSATTEKMSRSSQDKDSSNLIAGGHKEMGGGGGNFIAGVFLQAMKKKLSIYEAMVRGLLTPGTALVLLEAQAASGSLTDPVRNQRLSVDEALREGLIGRDFLEKLLSAEGAVRGYAEPYTGRHISLFQAMKKELIVKEHGVRLLEAQIATGGIIDPIHGHRIPVQVAHERGYLDEEMSRVLSNPKNQSRSCFDPNTQENVTYRQLLRRCVPDPQTGLMMLHVMDKGSALFQLSKDARKALQATLGAGTLQGQSVSLWELLFSRYVPDQQREELLRGYKAGTVTIPEMIFSLTTIIAGAEEENESLSSSRVRPDDKVEASQPLRDVEASQAVQDRLSSTVTTNHEVETSQLLHDLPSQELLSTVISNHEVETSQLLHDLPSQEFSSTVTTNYEVEASRPAQATPCEEQQLRRSLKSSIISVTAGELRGQRISLLDLLFSKYVPQEKRQGLLELYRAGILTTELVATVVTTILNRTGDGEATFVVNTRSPHRAVTRAEESGDEVLDQLDDILRSTRITLPASEMQGRQVCVWDLLFSSYIPEEKGQELLELYHEGLLTLEQMVTVVTNVIKKKESTGRRFHIAEKASEKDTEPAMGEKNVESHKEEPWERTLKTTVVHVEVGELRGRKVSVWDLLHSKSIPEENREELLELYKVGELTLEQVKTVVSTIVSKAEASRREEPGRARSPGAELGVAGAENELLQEDGSWEETLKSTTVEVPVGEFQGRKVSVWDLLFSSSISEEKRQELLELYTAGTLPLERLVTVVTTLVKKKESTGRKFRIAAKASEKDTEPATGEKNVESHKEEPWERTLKTTVVHVEVGEFRGRKVSVWDLLHSKSIPKENREELLELYKVGELTLEQVKTVVSTIVSKAEASRREELGRARSPGAELGVAGAENELLQEDGSWEETLKSTRAGRAMDEFQGRKVSVWDLLFSNSISEEKREELLHRYCAGTLTVEELVNTTSHISRAKNGRHLPTLPQQTMDLLQLEGSYLTFGRFQEQRVSVWELLSTQQVSEYRREAQLDSYGNGGLRVNTVTVTTTVVTGPRREERHQQDQ